MSTLEATIRENEICAPPGYEKSIMKVVTTTGELSVLTFSRTSKLEKGDCSEESKKVGTSSTGGDSASAGALCMLIDACKAPESNFFRGFGEEEQYNITTALKAKLETLVDFHSGRQKMNSLKVYDVQKTCGIVLEEERPTDAGEPRVEESTELCTKANNDHAKIQVNIDSVNDSSTGMPPSPFHTVASETTERYVDGQGSQKPTERPSCNVNRLPLHDGDEDVFQMGLLPPRYPRSMETSTGGVRDPRPRANATYKKTESKNQHGFGGFFEISHLLLSGELERVLLQHRLEETVNHPQQLSLRKVSEGQREQNNLENSSNPAMQENRQSVLNYFMQKQVDCTASTLHLMTHSNKKTYSSDKSRKVIPASLNYSPLLISTPVVASHDTRVISPLITPKLSVPKEMPKLTVSKMMPKLTVPRILKEGEPPFIGPLPKMPALTAKTFNKPGMAAEISLVSEKLTKNSKSAPINEPQSGQAKPIKTEKTFARPPPPLKRYGI